MRISSESMERRRKEAFARFLQEMGVDIGDTDPHIRAGKCILEPVLEDEVNKMSNDKEYPIEYKAFKKSKDFIFEIRISAKDEETLEEIREGLKRGL